MLSEVDMCNEKVQAALLLNLRYSWHNTVDVLLCLPIVGCCLTC